MWSISPFLKLSLFEFSCLFSLTTCPETQCGIQVGLKLVILLLWLTKYWGYRQIFVFYWHVLFCTFLWDPVWYLDICIYMRYGSNQSNWHVHHGEYIQNPAWRYNCTVVTTCTLLYPKHTRTFSSCITVPIFSYLSLSPSLVFTVLHCLSKVEKGESSLL